MAYWWALVIVMVTAEKKREKGIYIGNTYSPIKCPRLMYVNHALLTEILYSP